MLAQPPTTRKKMRLWDPDLPFSLRLRALFHTLFESRLCGVKLPYISIIFLFFVSITVMLYRAPTVPSLRDSPPTPPLSTPEETTAPVNDATRTTPITTTAGAGDSSTQSGAVGTPVKLIPKQITRTPAPVDLTDVPDWVLQPASFIEEGVSPPQFSSGEIFQHCLSRGDSLDVCLDETSREKAMALTGGFPMEGHSLDVISPALPPLPTGVVPHVIPSDSTVRQRLEELTVELVAQHNKAKHLQTLLHVLAKDRKDVNDLPLATMECSLYTANALPAGAAYNMWLDGHSAHGEDRYVIDNIFASKRGGVFVDVGSGRGVAPSNTWMLEKCYGWKGVCVEPNGMLTNGLVTERTGSLVVNGVLGLSEDTVPFTFFDGHAEGLSTGGLQHEWSPLQSQEIKAALHKFGGAQKQTTVSQFVLSDLLQSRNLPAVDFVNVDVGGIIVPTLNAMSLGTLSPRAIAIEMSLVHEDEKQKATELLSQLGYSQRRAIADTAIFVKSE